MGKIKIIIADDHDLFREGLAALLGKHEQMEVIATVADGEQLLQALQQQLPAIVLLDLTMPKVNGFEALKTIAKLYPNVKVIVISMHDDGSYIAKCARSGAYSYLLKNTDEAELLDTIQIVSAGRKYYSFAITEKMVNNMNTQGDNFKSPTKKELEILHLLAQGETTKEIASQLFVSTRTVETHRANLLKKLEVKNTAELIHKARELKLI